jgi:hypothetical protein
LSELPGFTYLGKKGKERYAVTPSVAKKLRAEKVKVTNGTISKRAYRNQQLKREGYKNLYQREKETQPGSAPKTGKARALFERRRKHIEIYAQRRNISTREAAKHSSDLERAWRDAQKEGFDKTYGGAFYRYLNLLGFQFVEADDGTFISP